MQFPNVSRQTQRFILICLSVFSQVDCSFMLNQDENIELPNVGNVEDNCHGFKKYLIDAQPRPNLESNRQQSVSTSLLNSLSLDCVQNSYKLTLLLGGHSLLVNRMQLAKPPQICNKMSFVLFRFFSMTQLHQNDCTVIEIKSV